MVDKGLKPSIINDKTMQVLRMMSHQAYIDEVIPKNPALGVKRLAQGLTDVDPFTIAEREEVVAGFRRYAPRRRPSLTTGRNTWMPPSTTP